MERVVETSGESKRGCQSGADVLDQAELKIRTVVSPRYKRFSQVKQIETVKLKNFSSEQPLNDRVLQSK